MLPGPRQADSCMQARMNRPIGEYERLLAQQVRIEQGRGNGQIRLKSAG